MSLVGEISEFRSSKRVNRSSVTNADELLHLDSLEFFRLTSFIQELTGVDFADEELTSDNFAAPRQIERLLPTKMAK
jgi:acyl carrier protein